MCGYEVHMNTYFFILSEIPSLTVTNKYISEDTFSTYFYVVPLRPPNKTLIIRINTNTGNKKKIM